MKERYFLNEYYDFINILFTQRSFVSALSCTYQVSTLINKFLIISIVKLLASYQRKVFVYTFEGIIYDVEI